MVELLSIMHGNDHSSAAVTRMPNSFGPPSRGSTVAPVLKVILDIRMMKLMPRKVKSVA